MTSARSPAAREIARRLLARETADAADPAAAAAAAAMQRVCTRVSANLRRTVGDDGRNALLSRALKATEADHPALTGIHRVDNAEIHLDGVRAAVDALGVPAVVTALESLLSAVADILVSLIGADMVLNILDDDGPSSQTLSGKEQP